jgi:hypothetical protein
MPRRTATRERRERQSDRLSETNINLATTSDTQPDKKHICLFFHFNQKHIFVFGVLTAPVDMSYNLTFCGFSAIIPGIETSHQHQRVKIPVTRVCATHLLTFIPFPEQPPLLDQSHPQFCPNNSTLAFANVTLQDSISELLIVVV